MSTFFLFGDLKSGLSETVQVSIQTVSFQTKKKEIFIFSWLYFYKIGSLVCTQKLGKSVCKKVWLLSPLNLGDAFLCCGPPSQPLLWMAQLSLVPNCCDDASILLDMAVHGKDGVKVQLPKVICRVQMCPTFTWTPVVWAWRLSEALLRESNHLLFRCLFFIYIGVSTPLNPLFKVFSQACISFLRVS